VIWVGLKEFAKKEALSQYFPETVVGYSGPLACMAWRMK
jgi:hypothetical protein